MKIIKKIAAIMLSVMMVLGMCSVVGAEGATTSGKYNDSGTITITEAIDGQTYTIYRILKLESFSRGDDRDKGNYAYKVEDGWESFVSGENIKDIYLKTDSSGYVTWVEGADQIKFTQEALKYAKTHSTDSGFYSASTTAQSKEVTFTNLKLGYYLVDSSAGALCLLDTTDKAVTIQEKNGVPSVKKEVQEDSKGNSNDAWGNENTADIGQIVEFRATITAQKGAEKYVLHDKMDKGLTFNNDIKVKKNETDVDKSNYTLNASITDECTFEIVFTQKFCDELNANDTIIVTYSATLNKDAEIAGEGNTNTAKLEYGDKNFTTPSITKTKTYEIPVFKYTNKNETEKALEGAEFTLTRDGETVPIKLVKVAAVAGASDDVYRVAMESETGETVISDGKVTTPSTGKFTIKGLDAGTYYLTETKQPDGYNKLTTPVTIIISDTGTITVNGTNVNPVKVENKSGSLLPSTGGMGTTLFYIFGAILVIGSGVVLITKKRMK